MNLAALKSEALQAFLVGAARSRPDFARLIGADGADAKADLKAAALLAQALRFERPAPPSGYAILETPVGRRAFVAETLRAPLVRLVGDDKFAVSPQDDLALGVALALERSRLSPHPFDFHRLEGFLRAHADRLGAEAQEWLDRGGKQEAKRGYFDLEVLSDDNWTDAPPARRARFLEERRRADPGAARALLEAIWPQEGAEIRLRLLQALRVGLGPEDQPFLESLAQDRAPKVRELAARLLTRLPDAGAENAALKDLLSRVKKTTTGVFRKRTLLALELPATVVKGDWIGWLVDAFAEIELDEFAAALQLSPEAAIAAATEDTALSAAFALMSARARRFDLLAEIARAESAPYLLLGRGAYGEDVIVSADDGAVFAEAVFQPGPRPQGHEISRTLGNLFRLIKTPVGAVAFDRMLADAGKQRSDAGEAVAVALLTPLVALAPPERRAAARAFAEQRAEKPERFFAYLDLIEALEGNAAHD